MRIFLSLMIMSSIIFAYIDADMDGVDDTVDQCPNTPITELVDIDGCSQEAREADAHYDIIIGASYAQVDYNTNEKTDTLSTTLQADYFQGNFSLQAITSYYSSESESYRESGLNDTVLAAYYLVPINDDFRIRLGAGVIFPTYDSSLNNNNTDYLGSISATYNIEDISLFGAYTMTMINDDDVPNLVTYQNTNAYNLGLGYHTTQKHYISASYYQCESVYVNVEDIKNVSVYNFYSFDKHWFTTLSYAYGLSDSTSDHYASVRLGYYY